ncbi:MAG: hypothetical protein IPO72_12640 [Saprospiraceae bacterium]|nr:hypothetical protein [Candidatus Vicinibacter affinis]
MNPLTYSGDFPWPSGTGSCARLFLTLLPTRMIPESEYDDDGTFFYDGLPILRTGFCISFKDVHLSAIPQEDEKKELIFVSIIKRGFVVDFSGGLVVSFGWSFNRLSVVFLVIWAIGISMVVLGLLINFVLLANSGLGALIVLGHNGLDYLQIRRRLSVIFFFGTYFIMDFTPHFLDGDHLCFNHPCFCSRTQD